jgi:hypothetical protein
MNARCLNGLGLAITTVAMLCQQAMANDGRPSRDTLADMGLSGMVVMSDDDAMAVRGMGFKGGSSVRVWGNSFATINTKGGSAHSENGYALEGKHFAAGGNLSFAGAVFTNSGGKGGHDSKPTWGGMKGGSRGGHTSIKSVVVFAGGFSFGKAH